MKTCSTQFLLALSLVNGEALFVVSPFTLRDVESFLDIFTFEIRGRVSIRARVTRRGVSWVRRIPTSLVLVATISAPVIVDGLHVAVTSNFVNRRCTVAVMYRWCSISVVYRRSTVTIVDRGCMSSTVSSVSAKVLADFLVVGCIIGQKCLIVVRAETGQSRIRSEMVVERLSEKVGISTFFGLRFSGVVGVAVVRI